MAILLVQHGRSAPKEGDSERGLTKEGSAEARRVAIRLKEAGVQLTGIFHSGKTRAKQTAEIFAAALAPGLEVQEQEGMNPKDDVLTFAQALENTGNQMFVGHLPFMEKLVSQLTAKSLKTPIVKFRNAGVVCLDYESERACWIIKWALVPEMC